jgi:Leucine-rich repeat (LRR) protein
MANSKQLSLALETGWLCCCFSSGMNGDAKVLLDLRRLSSHLKTVWKGLKISSDLTKIVLEGVTVNASGRVVKLNLFKKRLDGVIPSSIGQLAELTSLNLSRNEIYGVIPESIVGCKKLEELHLYQNRLEGEIPACIDELTALQTFHYPTVDKTTQRPPAYGVVPFLFSSCLATSVGFDCPGFDSDANVLLDLRKLSSHLKTVWKGLKISSDLTKIVLEGVTVNASGRVVKLNLYKKAHVVKGLDGVIPSSIGQLAELTSLNLSRNELYGVIPESIVGCKKLEELHLYQNRLEGEIPACIGELTVLRKLNVHSNWFNGAIPASLSNLSKLESMNLAQNELTGEFPLSLVRHKAKGCSMYLAKNTGFTLPENIGDLGGEFAVLNLSECSITGAIPISIGEMYSLEELYLSNNQMSGPIPASVFNLTNLGWLDLGKNSFSGSLPGSLARCSSLESLELGDNQLSGSLPAHIGSSACLPNLQVLDVRNNPQLTGEIDSEFLSKCKQCDISACSPKMQLGDVNLEVALGNEVDAVTVPVFSQKQRSGSCSAGDDQMGKSLSVDLRAPPLFAASGYRLSL